MDRSVELEVFTEAVKKAASTPSGKTQKATPEKGIAAEIKKAKSLFGRHRGNYIPDDEAVTPLEAARYKVYVHLRNKGLLDNQRRRRPASASQRDHFKEMANLVMSCADIEEEVPVEEKQEEVHDGCLDSGKK